MSVAYSPVIEPLSLGEPDVCHDTSDDNDDIAMCGADISNETWCDDHGNCSLCPVCDAMWELGH